MSRFYAGPRVLLLACAAGLCTTATAWSATAGSTTTEPSSTFHLDFAPRGFQKNPMLNMTVVTEMTAAGRAQPAASAEHPLYYVAHDNGAVSRGFASANEKTPAPDHLARVMRESLRVQGLVAVDESAAVQRAPDLAIFYSCGSNAAPDADYAGKFPEATRASLLERSLLVGGRKYVDEILRDDAFTGGSLNSPFSFVGRVNTTRFMYEQAQRDIYFIVISAYSYDSLARNERRLLWRTSMTVDALGVSMVDTLRPLLVTAAPYVGREVPAIALRRRMQKGSVELGPIKVIEDDVTLATK